jgi:hypothetical protein
MYTRVLCNSQIEHTLYGDETCTDVVQFEALVLAYRRRYILVNRDLLRNDGTLTNFYHKKHKE